MISKELQSECEGIMRALLTKYQFLHPHSTIFDAWNTGDAISVMEFLIKQMQKSPEILISAKKHDWGKREFNES